MIANKDFNPAINKILFRTMTQIRRDSKRGYKNEALDKLQRLFNHETIAVQSGSFPLVQHTFLLAIKITQEAVNNKGVVSFNDHTYYGSIKYELLLSLLREHKNKFEELVVHDGFNILADRKLSTKTVALVVCAIFEFIITPFLGITLFFCVFNLIVGLACIGTAIISYLNDTNYSDYSEKLRQFIHSKEYHSDISSVSTDDAFGEDLSISDDIG